MRSFVYQRLRKGYKLYLPYEIQTSYHPMVTTTVGCVTVQRNGLLRIDGGYCWDGASGPAKDDNHTLRASLVHDACYLLLRKGAFGFHGDDSWWYARRTADKLMRKIMRQDGASKFRAWYYYWGLRVFGDWAAMGKGGAK